MKIKWNLRDSSADYDSYGPAVEQFVSREFPMLSSGTVNDIVANVVAEFLGSKQTRVGARPNVESEALIRQTVRGFIQSKAPIPVLIPMASVKVPLGESLDIAELSALRVLSCLNDRVMRYYPPGLQFYLRLEDLTEFAISGDVLNIEHIVKTYQDQFKLLVKTLAYDKFIFVVPESTLTTREKFVTLVDDYESEFVAELYGSQSKLALIGWKGGVSKEFVQFLNSRYEKLYPQLDNVARLRLMSRYLGAILARRNLHATGILGERLEISFAPALPDAPQVSTRVYYRTVPLAQSSRHMSPWNAKGHFRISEDGSIRMALGLWTDEYTQGQLTIANNGVTAHVRADYMLED